MVELPAATCSSPASRPLQPAAEFAVEAVQALDQRPRQLVQRLALAGEGQAPADALEQRRAEVALQRLQLQGHRRLAQEQRLGRARHRAQPGDLAEGPQRLQAVALVVERGVAAGFGHCDLPSISRANTYPLKHLVCQIRHATAWPSFESHEHYDGAAAHVGSATRGPGRPAPARPTRPSRARTALLTPAALAFLAELHRRFEPRPPGPPGRPPRSARPVFDAGELPDFRADTARHPRRRLARGADCRRRCSTAASRSPARSSRRWSSTR